jgi:hypothetical protein
VALFVDWKPHATVFENEFGKLYRGNCIDVIHEIEGVDLMVPAHFYR